MKHFSWIWPGQAVFFLLPGMIYADNGLLPTKDHQIEQADNNTVLSHEPSTFYRRSRSYGVNPQHGPPAYVRNLSQTGIDAFGDLYWLDAGLDHRTRFEFRNNDIRRPQITNDYPILLRSRAYLGVREILDPLRLAVEFQDSRRYDSKFPKDNRDWDEYDLLQAYGELYFKDALGQDSLGNSRPIRIRGGRMTWEVTDRHLLTRNGWRNTTNNFEGFRITLGQKSNDWELDAWGVQPVIRLIDKFDRRDKNQWFYGAVVNWRRWSDIITLQPYYMGLMQDDNNGTRARREIHSPAIRAYGILPNTEMDFDIDVIRQFGRDDGQRKSAWAYLFEFGYTFPQHAWKPRISAFYGYVSGDRNPNDNVNNRFEKFFGSARSWSADDNIVMENVKGPKIKIEFRPLQDLQIDGGYNWFWLASKTDRFNNLFGGKNNRDPSGNSGDFLGHSVDIRARYRLTPYVNTTVGYSHWFNGEFVKKRQLAVLGKTTDSTNLFYIEVSIHAFK